MALDLKMSTGVRNAMLDVIESTIGTSAVLKIRSGTPPADCAAADAGSALATYNLASDWATAASSGAKALGDLPLEDTSADNSGTATHFRLYASDGTTCHMQGTVGTSDADMIIDNTTIVAGQIVRVTAFTLTDPHS